jgi:hypothetical protein
MVEGSLTSPNGVDAWQPPQPSAPLPELLHLTTADSSRVPSPGTLRELKAQTGKSWDELMGELADPADRFQTIIWSRLRRERPGLRWDDCADVELQIDEVPTMPDPTQPDGSGALPRSVGSGG